jgi:hypothetical protein
MSAVTVIVHSERNPSKSEPLHLLQIWSMPRTQELTPRWEQRNFSRSQRNGRLLAVVSDDGAGESLRIDQDATLYVAALNQGQTVSHELRGGRRAYVFAIDWELSLNGVTLGAGDQARITDESKLVVSASGVSELILLDLP